MVWSIPTDGIKGPWPFAGSGSARKHSDLIFAAMGAWADEKTTPSLVPKKDPLEQGQGA